MRIVPATSLSRLASMLLATIGLASCDSSNGSAPATSIRYAGDLPAYGIVVRSGASAAATTAGEAQDTACAVASDATAAGCSSEIDTTADGLRLALYGCFLAPGDQLFDCHLTEAMAETLRTDSTVRVGCGCQVNCPDAAAIAVCDEGSPECEDVIALQPTEERSTAPDSVATTQPGTGETTCSTCCETDFFPDEIGSAISDEPIAEIQVEVEFSEECRFDMNGTSDCDAYDPDDNWERVRFAGSSTFQRWCFASSGPAIATKPLPILSCRGLIDDVQVTRAVGTDFAPLSTIPSIVFEEERSR